MWSTNLPSLRRTVISSTLVHPVDSKTIKEHNCHATNAIYNRPGQQADGERSQGSRAHQYQNPRNIQ